MKTFKDSEGRSWDISATIGSLRRVKDLAEVDLTDPRRVAELGDDPFLLGSALYALCKPQIDAQNLTEEQFAAGFDGDVVEVATARLVEELVLFSRPAKRGTITRVLQKKLAVDQRLLEAAEEMIQENGWVDQMVTDKIQQLRTTMISGPPSTGSPASSASIPPA